MKGSFRDRLWPPNLLAITFVALAARSLTATWTGLTTDEGFAAALAQVGSWKEFMEHLRHDPNAPLFYALLKIYAQFFGSSDLSMKIFAVLLSTTSVSVIYLISKRFLGRELASQLGMMMALCPPVVRFGTFVRAYVLMPVLSLLCTQACMEVLARPKSTRWILTYGATIAVLIYSHYWGIFIPLGHVGLVLIGLCQRWFSWRQLRGWLIGLLFAFVVFLPWLPTFYYQISQNLSPWAALPATSYLFLETFPYIMVGELDVSLIAGQLGNLLCNVLIWIALLSPRSLIVHAQEDPDSKICFDGRHWKAVAVCSLLAALVTNFFRPIMRERYFTPFSPLFAVVFLSCFRATFPRLPAVARYLLPIVLWLPLWLGQLVLFVSLPETSTPAIVKEISESADPQKDLVLISFQSLAPALNFYLPSSIEVVAFPDLVRTCFTRWDGMDSRLRDSQSMDRLFAKLETVFARGGRIWLVDRARNIRDVDPTDNSLVQGIPFIAADLVRMDQIRTWLRFHAQQVGINKLAPGREFSIFLSVWKGNAAVK